MSESIFSFDKSILDSVAAEVNQDKNPNHNVVFHSEECYYAVLAMVVNKNIDNTVVTEVKARGLVLRKPSHDKKRT
ncbi:hypothetical protein GYMLUDRAFT_240171 [Collybiopsis luxurians FD-317 M1]|nr:hypothetical protein GYMLUDRAFT_240171 [Collybiopsis luxurians FD-317 M1]